MIPHHSYIISWGKWLPIWLRVDFRSSLFGLFLVLRESGRLSRTRSTEGGLYFRATDEHSEWRVRNPLSPKKEDLNNFTELSSKENFVSPVPCFLIGSPFFLCFLIGRRFNEVWALRFPINWSNQGGFEPPLVHLS